jgi:hypothetical protein
MTPIPSTNGSSCGTSLRFPPVKGDSQRCAVKVDDQMMFGASAGAVNS